MKILSDNTYDAIMDKLIELENENKELRAKLAGTEALLDASGMIIKELRNTLKMYNTLTMDCSDFKFGD